MWEDSMLEGTYFEWLPNEILCVIFKRLGVCEHCGRFVDRNNEMMVVWGQCCLDCYEDIYETWRYELYANIIEKGL